MSYFTGLFEGEGNAGVVTIRERKTRKSGKIYERDQKVPYVQLCMTDPEPVYALQVKFGGSVSTRKIPSGKTVYYWRVSNRKALAVAHELVGSCLSPRKRGQLTAVINHYDNGHAA